MTAYAKSPPDTETGYKCECETDSLECADTEPEPTPTPTPEPTAQPTPPPDPQTLTPPGNLTLVDDFDGELAQDKQFITVVTRNGHFFYIVIDRAGERNNVHFLNQVDEYSLWSILEEEVRRPTPPAPIEPTPEPELELPPDAEPEPEQQGGGAYYYFKVMKPKQGDVDAAISELDEFNLTVTNTTLRRRGHGRAGKRRP